MYIPVSAGLADYVWHAEYPHVLYMCKYTFKVHREWDIRTDVVRRSRSLGSPYVYIPGSVYMLYIAPSVKTGRVTRTKIR